MKISIANDSDHDWEIWGKTDPYFGVFSDPKFSGSSLSKTVEDEFFESGVQHVSHVYETIRTTLQQDFNPDSILDFGCGVGRLLIPFCYKASKVTGVDVSQSMLAKAQEHCERLGLHPKLVQAEKLPLLAPESVQFIHSSIVMQHIPVARGEAIFQRLLSILETGGFGAVHFTYSSTSTGLGRSVAGGLRTLRKKVKGVNGLANLVKGRKFSAPLMQMNFYSLNRLFDILAANTCHSVFTEFSDHDGHRGVMLYFQKSPRRLL